MYDTLYPELRLYLYSFVSDESEIQDIIQDAFLKLLEENRLDKIANLRSYLYSCVRNSLYNRTRDERTRKRIHDEMRKENLALSDVENRPFFNERLFKLTGEAIGTLPPVCKSIFLMAKRDHLSYKEIASKLGVSIKTVESQMGIAFKKIRKYVFAAGYEKEEEDTIWTEYRMN